MTFKEIFIVKSIILIFDQIPLDKIKYFQI